MTQRYIVMDGNLVVNLIIWDGDAENVELPGDTMMLDPDSPVGPGWRVEGGEWIAPRAPDEPDEPGEPEPVVE